MKSTTTKSSEMHRHRKDREKGMLDFESDENHVDFDSPTPEVNKKKTVCEFCGKEYWYKFVRCPSCNELRKDNFDRTLRT